MNTTVDEIVNMSLGLYMASLPLGGDGSLDLGGGWRFGFERGTSSMFDHYNTPDAFYVEWRTYCADLELDVADLSNSVRDTIDLLRQKVELVVRERIRRARDMLAVQIAELDELEQSLLASC